MKKKLLLQDISDHIAQQEGISKKDADTFVRAFFEVIEQGLLEENFVKIKGLGTFKLVTVSERESVNINTGERFQISSHTKVTFTPDSSMKELVNRPFAHFETVDLSDETSTTELDQIDQAMLESLEAEDAEGDTEEDIEDLSEETPTTDEATDEEETLEATEEDVP
ncbi:MAG: HU family DNA-binding protein, partial [Prevotellamassilia sp.]